MIKRQRDVFFNCAAPLFSTALGRFFQARRAALLPRLPNLFLTAPCCLFSIFTTPFFQPRRTLFLSARSRLF